MTYQLTKHHSLTIETVWFDWTTGNWSLSYIIRDTLTKSEKKDTYCFDRWFASPKENAQFISDKFCENYKGKMLL